MTRYGPATEKKIGEVAATCQRYGNKAIIALAGVPGTGKSFIAEIAAQRIASDPLMVRTVQFHPSFSYEEFIEGMRLDNKGGVEVKPGIFLEWNQMAQDDEEHTYVLLIEELTRANLATVLGELMTYIEHRNTPFVTVYGRQPIKISERLVILATYNPSDRTAIEVDGALLRRLRVISCPPDVDQLEEMLKDRNLCTEAVNLLKNIFVQCRSKFPDDYEHLMPFGHGIFDQVQDEEPDLYHLWEERIRHILRRPLIEPHPFTKVIEDNYPWKRPGFTICSSVPTSAKQSLAQSSVGTLSEQETAIPTSTPAPDASGQGVPAAQYTEGDENTG